EAHQAERRIAEPLAEGESLQAETDSAHAAIGESEAEVTRARAALPAGEVVVTQAAADLRATEAEMSAAEQAQGVEEARESHALKLLSQIEARKNRLKQENMGLVFPEPEKLAALEGERSSLQKKRARLDSAERLWQAIRVEAGWDDAVEAALGVRLNAAKLNDASALAALLRDAPPGNFAVFVERGAAGETPIASRLSPLATVVTSGRQAVTTYLRDALANVFILPDGEDGMELARVLPAAGLLVSKAGHLFSRQGVVF